MSGELEPNSHQNIKMTLVPSRFPAHFEGEIQCSIEWETPQQEENQELKSVQTTPSSENQELLFLRLKKRTKFVSFICLSLTFLFHCLAKERRESH
jgi:hypothetical protein